MLLNASAIGAADGDTGRPSDTAPLTQPRIQFSPSVCTEICEPSEAMAMPAFMLTAIQEEDKDTLNKDGGTTDTPAGTQGGAEQTETSDSAQTDDTANGGSGTSDADTLAKKDSDTAEPNGGTGAYDFTAPV
ncbi:MAG: hypothetical protein WCQ72_07990, partial [Eubacteriales bacterium]